LLSQVDASIGGKVGIDLNHLKNELGLFNNPLAVFVDSTFLHTLDKRQLLSGFAEMIKHALIADVNYWKKIKKANFSELGKFNELIETSIQIKNKVLNFGHTVGHALEAYFLEQQKPQKSLLHGEAIAIGMICEAYLSNRILKLLDDTLKEITTFILSIYKPVYLSEKDSQRLIELMFHDKKNEKGKLNFSLLSSIGKCEINNTAEITLVKESLKYYSEQAGKVAHTKV
jgi:3-dehydroquinate synthase